MAETHDGEPAVPEPPPVDGVDRVGAFLHRWEGVCVALVGLLAALAQVASVLENQWRLVAVSAVLLAVFLAFYVLSHRTSQFGTRRRRAIRLVALGALVGIPAICLPAFVAATLLPRWVEDGSTLAIARFAGPPFPQPYLNCRPSDMLVDDLRQIADRYGHLKVFELPYVIEPNGRWAPAVAQSHGLLQSADVVVYGEFNLLGNGKVPAATADRVLVEPHVSAVPTIPLPYLSVPLPAWEFPARVTSIDDLCSGKAPGFLDDARRLALTIVGARLSNAHDTLAAERALAEARFPRGPATPQEDCNGSARIDDAKACPGVLAFYLANLDHALGNDEFALSEYRYASQKLLTAAPFIDLGELYAARGRPDDALNAFGRAVDAEPNSVAALATLALYERDRGLPRDLRDAAVDLDRALRQPAANAYDEIALAHALHQRSAGGDCDLRRLEAAMARRDFNPAAMIDTLVVHGRWLRDRKRTADAIRVLEQALRFDPQRIKANYTLGLALRDAKTEPQATAAFVRTTHAHGYTAEELLDQANAAHELGDDDLARRFYGGAIEKNHNAVYAYFGRALAERKSRDLAGAERDVRAALAVHPKEAMLLDTLSDILADRGRLAAARALRARADGLLKTPNPFDAYWSPATCGYEGLDVASR
jgi:tetratricopeptide (TPR) repeat protein